MPASETVRSHGRRHGLWGHPRDERAPRIDCIEDRRRVKESVHLIQASVVLYGRSHFSLSIEARRLRHTLAAFPNPPESDITRGVKEPCSISLTRSS